MKFTLSWLRDHLETSASIEDLSTTLSAIGLEVDGIENPGAALKPFVIAKIVKAEPHPDADRLRVCQVDTGSGMAEVVCGAPNAKAGLIGVFAPLGAHIPGTGITLERRPVRGVVSNGMMLSERELEISDDHDGIIELGDDYADQLGASYAEVFALDDPVFDVSLTPNRPDCTGVRGIARDLAAAGLGKLKPEPEPGKVEGSSACPVDIVLDFPDDAKDACPVFAGRYVAGVKNGPSPAWMQVRLRAIGLRPISALVDITNYISVDRGRPLHVYDADKLHGTVRARLGRKGESFVGLDGKTYQVDDTMTVIADDRTVLGLGGVIGGEDSGCTETTTNVLIESAWFDPVRTATTGRKCGLITDARYRFERGVDPASVLPGLDLATQMVLEFTGGKPSKRKMAGKPPLRNFSVEFRPERVEELTGLRLKDSETARILKALGFVTTGKGKVWKVAVPSWRPDVHGAADLVEEVVRIAGLDRVPPTPLPRLRGVAAPVLTLQQKRMRRARRVLASRGLVEAITWSFIPRALADHFGGKGGLDLENPMSKELSTMRPSLLPGLIGAAARNRNHGQADLAMFEMGQCFAGDQPEDQYQLASGIRSGTAKSEGAGRHGRGAAGNVDVMDAKADAMTVLASLGIDQQKVQISRDVPQWYHPGRSGVIRLGPKIVLAQFGEIHPATARLLDIDGALVAFEVFLDALPAPRKRQTKIKPVFTASDLLPVRRDFAFVVNADVSAADLLRAAYSANKKLISNVNLFDVFEGDELAKEGKKSLAIEVTLNPVSKTLTDDEIDAVAQKIIAAIEKATGGEIRR